MKWHYWLHLEKYSFDSASCFHDIWPHQPVLHYVMNWTELFTRVHVELWQVIKDQNTEVKTNIVHTFCGQCQLLFMLCRGDNVSSYLKMLTPRDNWFAPQTGHWYASSAIVPVNSPAGCAGSPPGSIKGTYCHPLIWYYTMSGGWSRGSWLLKILISNLLISERQFSYFVYNSCMA